jgi:hypothetical protein
MSLDTYDNLKKEIIDWSHRNDVDLKIDTFIRIAETEMFANPVEVLRVRGQEIRSRAVTNGQYLALPDDFQSVRAIRFLTNEDFGEMRFRAPEQMVYQPSTGRPNFFTIGAEIEFDRVPDSNYDIEIHYYATPAPLTAANQTNEVLSSSPNIYLYGALWALYGYANDQIEQQKYGDMFLASIKGANKKFKKGRYGPSPAMTPVGCTP